MHPLSHFEATIIRELASGAQTKEIARSIDRSPATVEFYVRILFAKFDARSRAQLVARAYDQGALIVCAPGAPPAVATTAA